ncbi:hypothetical protein Y032_0032g2572 [Ancylostoma ceylanicum]|nr:hypothetical protein Y032_0032g2572 [Ancylostoma ceylanicum]
MCKDIHEVAPLFGTDYIEQGYNKLMQHYLAGNKNPELLWRLTRATLETADLDKNHWRRAQLICEGRTYGIEAAFYAENNPNALRWAAVATAYYCDFLSGQEKIEECKKSIDYTLKGLRINPDDHVLLFIKGRWMLYFCGLSSLEKERVRHVFHLTGREPTVSVGQAQATLMRAYSIEPRHLPTLQYLALCWLAQGDASMAKYYLKEALDLRVEGCNLHVQAECAQLFRQCV